MNTTLRATILLACVAGSTGAQATAPDAPLTDDERIRHVLSRFAFGPTPGLVEQVRAEGLDAWFERQLAASAPETDVLTARLAELPALEWTLTQLHAEYAKLRDDPPDFPAHEQLRDAVLYRAVYGQNQLLEVAADFFRNHLNVDGAEGAVRYHAVDWERAVIRRHAVGDFGAMLHGSAKHPAMLVYLDNYLSRRPLSKGEVKKVEMRERARTASRTRGEVAAEIASQRGLNENYARELLELHTLGVDRYYRQQDVVELAKALTGWTVGFTGDEYGFVFAPDLHCRGEKRILGQAVRAPNTDQIEEGERVLDRLIRHKGTAAFLSWKLCRYLVADDPPDAMVKRVAAVWRRTKGRLPEVYRAIYADRAFFDRAHFQAKFKRPFEFVVSALRVTGAEVTATHDLHQVLSDLSEPVYQCEDPTGYYDTAEAWRDPGVMARRWRFARELVDDRLPGVAVPGALYAGLDPDDPASWRDTLARQILPVPISARTARVIDRQVAEFRRRDPEAPPQRVGAWIVGLLLGAPEFQRQ